LAREGVTEECSMMLKKIELVNSDEEYDILDDEMEEMVEEEDAISLADLDLLHGKELTSEPAAEGENKKNQKRKTKWVPMERIPRPKRGHDDGLTITQRAQKLKKIMNLEKGNTSRSFAFESNSNLMQKAQCVNLF
jgi:hypothetical protein